MHTDDRSNHIPSARVVLENRRRRRGRCRRRVIDGKHIGV